MIQDFINYQNGVVNFGKLSIIHQVTHEFYHPTITNDLLINKKFCEFYDEIHELIKRHPDHKKKLQHLLNRIVIPMMAHQETIDDYKIRAYENYNCSI